MSTSKTQNYSLHAWEPADDFLRAEFNENFAALDAALKTLSDVDAQKAEIVVGSYTGDGQTERTISLGFTPRAVFVHPAFSSLHGSYQIYGGLAIRGGGLVWNDHLLLSVVDGGFLVRNESWKTSSNSATITVCGNATDLVYYYLALA